MNAPGEKERRPTNEAITKVYFEGAGIEWNRVPTPERFDFVTNKGGRRAPKISYGETRTRARARTQHTHTGPVVRKMSYDRRNGLPFERRQLPKDFRANYERPLRDRGREGGEGVVNNLPPRKKREGGQESIVNAPSIKIIRSCKREKVARKTHTHDRKLKIVAFPCILRIKVK